MPPKAFISYAHDNRDDLEDLLKYLEPLQQEGLLAPWSDRLIDFGEPWQTAIEQAMEDCRLGIFLVTAELRASAFIRSREQRRLLERQGKGEIEILPIQVWKCDLHGSGFEHLQPLPDFGRFIHAAGEDKGAIVESWTRVVTEIRAHARELVAKAAPTIRYSGIPFPGLRAFEPEEALIFFGRDDEKHELARRLEGERRFLVVFGDSGSGKSSLVKAGLVPAWRARRPEGEGPLLLTTPHSFPDHNPFTALVAALPRLPAGSPRPEELVHSLVAQPRDIGPLINLALKSSPKEAEALVVIDQFEELFAQTEPDVDPTLPERFIDLIDALAGHPRARVVLTLRHDFYHRLAQSQAMARRINASEGYQLPSLGADRFRDIILGPAAEAGFTFEDGLVTRLVDDARQAGNERGVVPLLAFALARLAEPFRERLEAGVPIPTGERRFLTQTYVSFHGISGAVASAADAALKEVRGDRSLVARLAPRLVTVSPEGTNTRKRARLAELDQDPKAAALAEALVRRRLLIKGKDTLEVAHEALFSAWGLLTEWIDQHRDDLRLRERLLQEARQWQEAGRDRHQLWKYERQEPLYQALARLGEGLDQLPEPARSFARPEPQRLLDEIADPATDHEAREEIGARWARIGDPRPGVVLRPDGLPDIAWCEVPGGRITLEDGAGSFRVEPFRIARYPLTRAQYQPFLDDPEGYDRNDWWDDLERPQPRWKPTGAGPNYPVGLVSWHESMAYARWLTARLRERGELKPGEVVRLPSEWEWQQAATGGEAERTYPWGPDFDPARANTEESGLMRASAVGLYPAGASPVGALDMAGNSWEWCLNRYDEPAHLAAGGNEPRVVRGVSWINNQDNARAAYRNRNQPDNRNNNLGFRLCVASHIALHPRSPVFRGPAGIARRPRLAGRGGAGVMARAGPVRTVSQRRRALLGRSILCRRRASTTAYWTVPSP